MDGGRSRRASGRAALLALRVNEHEARGRMFGLEGEGVLRGGGFKSAGEGEEGTVPHWNGSPPSREPVMAFGRRATWRDGLA